MLSRSNFLTDIQWSSAQIWWPYFLSKGSVQILFPIWHSNSEIFPIHNIYVLSFSQQHKRRAVHINPLPYLPLGFSVLCRDLYMFLYQSFWFFSSMLCNTKNDNLCEFIVITLHPTLTQIQQLTLYNFTLTVRSPTGIPVFLSTGPIPTYFGDLT